MKKFFSFILLVLIVSCGDKVYTTVADHGVEPSEDRLFDGYFNLNGGSGVNCIYLDEKLSNVVDIEVDCQSLVTVNPKNKSLGQFPTIAATSLFVINGEIKFTKNLNYTTGNDIEEDQNGSNITGSRRTDFRIYIKNDLLHLNIDIYKNSNNNNLNEVVASRKFREI